MSRIGFTAMLNPPDPNCIVLTSTTSHRLGKLIGTYDDEQFSKSLETYMDLQHSKNAVLEKLTKNLKMENALLRNRIEVLSMQRMYLGVCFLLAMGVLFVLVVH